MEQKDRFTTPGKHYTAEQLRMLQEFEDTGWKASEITPKPGSPAAMQREPQVKRKVRLITGTTLDGRRNRYFVEVDGEEMSLEKFGKMVGVTGNVMRGWIQYGTFDKNLKERGLI